MSANTWKLQDAKARFSELVRRARKGHPQRVTVHGKDAVVVVDPERFEIRPKGVPPITMAEFIERSKAYRAKDESEEVEFDRRIEMGFRPSPFEWPEDKS
jgi:antitoxin Phd